MIDWIEDVGKAWGVQKRRIVLGGYWYANDGFHYDGFSARSVAAKLWEEREAAGEGARRQKALEVLTGEALLFARATEGVSEQWCYLLAYRYIVPNRIVPPKSKLVELRELFPKRFKSRDDYYDELHACHCYLMGRWPDVPRGTNSSDTVATL